MISDGPGQGRPAISASRIGDREVSSRDDNQIQEENRQDSQIDTSGYEKTLRAARKPGGSGRRRQDRDEDDWDDYEPEEVYPVRKKKGRGGRILFWIIFVEVMAVACGVAYLYISRGNPDVEDLLAKDPKIAYETETEPEAGIAVPKPPVDVQLLTINEWSRPGIKVDSIEKVVVHYLANPRTTAQENHDYFESLKNLQNTYMSANYVVGLNGEIIQCVPDEEVAWASNEANYYSISVENCHPTGTGKLNTSTYWSLVHLVAYLTEKYNLGRDDIIRHYDITGKDCPKWFVEHPDAWEKFKDDVMVYRQECEQAQSEAMSEARAAGIPEEDVLATYLQENVTVPEPQPETSDQSLWDVLKKKAERAYETQTEPSEGQ
jgi:N-acetyl-anhydromuramyl-L-alanine amidase AmpD